MTVSYEWGPDDTAWTVLRDVFALPLNPIPGWARAGRTFAGRNPLKWALLVLGALGYVVAILIYWLFALFPAGSYVFLRVLTAPCFIAVYVVRAIVSVRRRRRAFVPATLEPASTSSWTSYDADSVAG